MGRNVLVVPVEGGWAVKVEDQVDEAMVHATREEAMEAGRARARTEEADLMVLDETGAVEERETYGEEGPEPDVEDPVAGP
jgi:hypothetical protein